MKVILLAILAIVLVAHCQSGATSIYCEGEPSDAVTVKIGYSISTAFPPYIPEASRIFIEENIVNLERGVGVFKDWLQDKRICLGTQELIFEIVRKTDSYTPETIKTAYETMVGEGVDFFISGFGTLPSNAGSEVTEIHKKVFVTSTASSHTFSEGKRYAFSVYPTILSRTSAIFPLYRMNRVESVTMITPEPGAPASIATSCSGFVEELNKNSITQIREVPYNASYDPDQSMEVYRDAAIKIAEQDSDLIIYCGIDGFILSAMIEFFKEMDYTPKGLISTTQEHAFSEVGDFLVRTTTLLNRDVGFPEGDYIKNEEEFAEIYKAAHGELAPNYQFGYYSLFALELILNGIRFAGNLDPIEVSHAIRTHIYNCFYGEIYFDARNQILSPGVALQTSYGVDHIIGPNTVATKQLVYPMPTWKERVEDFSHRGVEIAVIVVTCLVILNSIGWLIYLIIKRKKREIVASSPLFLAFMIIGSIIVYIGVLLWMPAHMTNAGCSAHVAFLMAGFMFLFGSMVVKSWRVHMLFSNKTLDVFKISNTQVALFLSALLSVDVILFLVWTLLTKPALELNIPNPDKPSMNYYTCSTTPAGTIVVWVILGYNVCITLTRCNTMVNTLLKILLFLYGAYLAIRVRSIPFKIYDESKIIAFCIYNVGFVAILISIIEAAGATDRYTQFTIRSFLIILSVGITINTMFIGKITLANPNKLSSSTTGSGVSKMQTTNEEELKTTNQFDYESAYFKVAEQKKKLKKEVKELRKALDAIKDAQLS